jgi:hypothetical protein
MIRKIARRFPAAGLLIGAAAWLVSTQAGYSLQGMMCRHGTAWFAAGGLALSLLGLAGARLSYEAFAGEPEQATDGTPGRLLAALGVAGGILFALVIALQASATLALTGCER